MALISVDFVHQKIIALLNHNFWGYRYIVILVTCAPAIKIKYLGLGRLLEKLWYWHCIQNILAWSLGNTWFSEHSYVRPLMNIVADHHRECIEDTKIQ